ncbi:cephalosporin hydroxylase family protein [Aeromonas veronii]|uniref:cephalosporin hydroxylase family protein n=1 Tax=Aeromonas veronii TaxID=654 RepID=UPI00266591F7|nr:cephalosporin hydroxylase family protein [Aeromonas veronii]MDO2435639.1 cephalosporin hydroxylase family protein [Aeromonas veronii]
MTNPKSAHDKYHEEIHNRLHQYADNSELAKVKHELLEQMNANMYAYNFTWFGRPVIQIPQDTITFQELIWAVKPDLIIETGIAHGGSLIFSASILALLELFGLVNSPTVVGVDIDIRAHNRLAIEQHPAAKWIKMIEGSSISSDVINQVHSIAKEKKRIMVFLDSNHTHSHVLAELQAYAPLVTKDSYCIVADTGIEDISPALVAPGREWGKGNSPKSALMEYLKTHNEFEIDNFYHDKAWVTSAPGGYLKRIR